MTAWTFFFGVLIMLPFDIGFGSKISLSTLTDPGVFMGLAFLGVFASALCYATWTGAVPGASEVECGNYRDMDLPAAKAEAAAMLPVLEALTADETLPPLAIAGIVTIFVGLIVAQKGH